MTTLSSLVTKAYRAGKDKPAKSCPHKRLKLNPFLRTSGICPTCHLSVVFCPFCRGRNKKCRECEGKGYIP